MHKSGFVCIVGRPNVGKSSLMNNILGQKISIISKTAQTTRNSIKGIYSCESSQIIFVDTPGIHKPQNDLGEFMNKQSYDSLKDCDCILWIVDASEEFGGGDSYMLHVFEGIKTPVILVFNKMDLVDENSESFNENKNKFIEGYNFKGVNYISAINGNNVNTLIKNIEDNLEEGPCYYDENQVTDSIERFIVSELIREKIFLLARQEVPHSVAVEIEAMKEDEDDPSITNVFATIVCDRDSQKKILIGAGASMIKNIKKLAKRDIQVLLGTKVYLELWIKVDKDWRNKQSSLKRLGYK